MRLKFPHNLVNLLAERAHLARPWSGPAVDRVAMGNENAVFVEKKVTRSGVRIMVSPEKSEFDFLLRAAVF